MAHRRALLGTLVALGCALALGTASPPSTAAGPGDPVDPRQEAHNYARTLERSQTYLTPAGLAQQALLGPRALADALAQQVGDPGRFFLPDVCFSGALTCAGDTRLAHWKDGGHGLVRPVLFTARNGATLAGHVWATRSGPRKRPLVVVTPGSVQAPEQLYWWAAQTLAKAGYVVLTRDAQGQAKSDTFGAGQDFLDSVPSQTAGVTFYDGTQDALDFALSRRAAPYCPRASRSGTSHCAKQRRRVGAGKATAYNPFARLVDRTRVGLAGHSYGAAGVSWVGQQDHRVDAVVAWDNLCDLTAGSPDRLSAGAGVPAGCLEGGRGHPRPRVPSLGLSADYGLAPTPNTTRPDPQAKSAGSRAFSRAGVDTGEVVIRGGTHFEFSYLPNPAFGATLRGIELASWYTTAWMDRYVKGDRSAQRRLLADGWRHDPRGGGNLYSFYYRSRLDLGHDDGRRVRCEDLRAGCRALVRDRRTARYSYVRVATTKDR